MTHKLASIGLVSLIFLVLIYTDPIWTRSPGGLWIPLISLFIVVLLLWLAIKLIKEIIGLIKNRKAFQWNHSLPTILIIVVLGFTFFNTISFDIENGVYGKVIFRACYEGTQNHTTFKLRENNRFEIHAVGALFSDSYFTGQYSQKGDTLKLVYDGIVDQAVGDKVFMNNRDKLLEPIQDKVDSSRYPFVFYYGYCKALN